jgi:hypothetical protein
VGLIAGKTKNSSKYGTLSVFFQKFLLKLETFCTRDDYTSVSSVRFFILPRTIYPAMGCTRPRAIAKNFRGEIHSTDQKLYSGEKITPMHGE